jgi:hypothetical protein
MTDKKTKGTSNGKIITDVIISGFINFSILYFFFSLYNIYFNNEDLVSLPRILVSAFAVVCIYFLSNDYFSVLYKIRDMKNERTDK